MKLLNYINFVCLNIITICFMPAEPQLVTPVLKLTHFSILRHAERSFLADHNKRFAITFIDTLLPINVEKAEG